MHRMIIYDIMNVDTYMTKIKPIVRIPNVVAKNLLDTRYRQKIVKSKKKYNRKRDKDVSDITYIFISLSVILFFAFDNPLPISCVK